MHHLLVLSGSNALESFHPADRRENKACKRKRYFLKFPLKVTRITSTSTAFYVSHIAKSEYKEGTYPGKEEENRFQDTASSLFYRRF